MTIVQKMRRDLPPAMKARDAARTNSLRYWIARLTLGTGAEMADAEAIKAMRGVLKEAASGKTTFTAADLDFIRSWVPPALTPDQIAAALAPSAEAIQAAPKEGMAIGLAMKALAGQAVDSGDVRAAVAALRG